jgi:hypothetical protein
VVILENVHYTARKLCFQLLSLTVLFTGLEHYLNAELLLAYSSSAGSEIQCTAQMGKYVMLNLSVCVCVCLCVEEG